ncbi:MAG TPA: sigma-70 family RNA polymerase sigma factor [Gemmataceae bacterium]|nr:sigma-70 family RNA polymerase sigma factor [Gemmataceae bacterium]
MANRQLNHLLRWIRGLAQAPAAPGDTDRQLLESFAARHDEAAFAALVQRHGALVWGACRRVLQNEQDAEDAFQAVFLVLARKAGTVRWREDIGNWLYGVACRVAAKARVQAARRPLKERQALSMPVTQDPGDGTADELRSVLDEEVNRLPEKYRAPIVLCYLKGKTYAEAAQLLGWAEGTVSGRLARARDLLHSRLVRRGVALSGGGLATVLSQVTASAAPPAALVHTTIRAAVGFAAGAPIIAGAVSHQAAVLAEGVLKSMLLTKVRIGAAILLAVGLAGTGAGVLTVRALVARRTDRPEQVTPPAVDNHPDRVVERPPLKKAWVGRWQADPFAGTEWIEVKRAALGPGARTYGIKEPKVVASLLTKLRITAVHNDFASSNIPPAWLDFHKKDGSTFAVSLANDGTIQAWSAEIRVDRAYISALNRHLSEKTGHAVDVLQFLPSPPASKAQPIVRPTLDSLNAGFNSLSVQYTMGKRLREVRVMDPKALDALHRALTVVRLEDDKGRKGLPWPTLTIAAKDKSTLSCHVLNDNELFIWDLGRVTVKPAFLKTLNRQVSRLEDREVNILGDNKLTEQQVKREREFRKLLSEASALRVVNKKVKSGPQVIDKLADVASLVKALARVEVPLTEVKLPAGDLTIDITAGKGRKVQLTYLQTGDGNQQVAVSPLGEDLVQVSGFGQVWVDNQWKYQFGEYAAKLQREAQERKADETTRLVCRDLPAFKEQVINVVVEYNQGGSQITDCLTAERSRPILDVLNVDKVEKLDWTRARWQAEFRKLEARGAGGLDLVPGLGFSLPLMITGEKEMLIPLYGRVTFKTSPLAAIRKAVESDPEKQKSVGLLPQ